MSAAELMLRFRFWVPESGPAGAAGAKVEPNPIGGSKAGDVAPAGGEDGAASGVGTGAGSSALVGGAVPVSAGGASAAKAGEMAQRPRTKSDVASRRRLPCHPAAVNPALTADFVFGLSEDNVAASFHDDWLFELATPLRLFVRYRGRRPPCTDRLHVKNFGL